jgi:hypothetical protein
MVEAKSFGRPELYMVFACTAQSLAAHMFGTTQLAVLPATEPWKRKVERPQAASITWQQLVALDAAENEQPSVGTGRRDTPAELNGRAGHWIVPKDTDLCSGTARGPMAAYARRRGECAARASYLPAEDGRRRRPPAGPALRV